MLHSHDLLNSPFVMQEAKIDSDKSHSKDAGEGNVAQLVCLQQQLASKIDRHKAKAMSTRSRKSLTRMTRPVCIQAARDKLDDAEGMVEDVIEDRRCSSRSSS